MLPSFPRFLPSVLAAVTLSLVTALPVSAQQRPRTSPHETISLVVDTSRVMIVYGRPYSKDPKSGAMREIWGSLVPYGKVWRTGADEATLFLTQKPLVVGGTVVPAGVYSLFTQPEADGTAKLIFNKQVGHWGTQYDAKQDFARVALTKDALPASLDQFTMAIEKLPAGGGVIKLSWAQTQYSVAFTVQK
jgi:hypothetical protein